MSSQITICPFTGLPTINPQEKHSVSYEVNVAGKTVFLNVCKGCFRRIESDQSEVIQYRHVLIGLLYNGLINVSDSVEIHWGDHVASRQPGAIDLQQVVKTAIYPKTPREKLESLFSILYKMQKFDGNAIGVDTYKNGVWTTWFFHGKQELHFYLQTLQSSGYIIISNIEDSGFSIRITYEGLNFYIKSVEEGYNSKNVFVAMAFRDETSQYREAIKNAIKSTGYEPIIVDERNVPKDRTLVDEIIASIRKCKFVISDFCYHRNGVYFESGFAIGLGKDVILTCQSKHFEEAHFDTKSLQHIVYETPEELEKKLTTYINAWIVNKK